jgi:hypothetical protein
VARWAGGLWVSSLLLLAVPALRAEPAAPPPPALLSRTGLYAGPATGPIDPRNIHYAPQYPLWSDGAEKSRWAFIPPGTTIGARDTDRWDFPVGTKFWKEFVFGGRKVETRFLWKTAPDGWVFATYLWNEAQTDAALAPETGVRDYVEIAPGRRHSIPAVTDCRSCHDSARTEVLGFSALQLSTDRDPNAPHAEPLAPGMATLRTLVENHLLDPPREDLLRDPPRIRASSPRQRAALGYLSANCGSCHNSENPIAPLGLLLRHDSSARDEAGEPAVSTTIGRESRYALPGAAPGGTMRIRPGAPDQSSLLYRMASRRPSSQMPPLGTVVADEEAIELLRRWIAEDLPVPSH